MRRFGKRSITNNMRAFTKGRATPDHGIRRFQHSAKGSEIFLLTRGSRHLLAKEDISNGLKIPFRDI